MTMGMSDHGRDVLESALGRLNDRDLQLVPQAAKELMECRLVEYRRKVLEARRVAAQAQIDYELACKKFGLSPEPEDT